jgi:Ca-activated chloride channel family protein
LQRRPPEAVVERFAGLAAALVALAAVTHAQTPVAPLPPPAAAQQPSDRTVFRSAASMVALNVTVTDGRKLVTGLDVDDFQIYEDGVPQQVRFFESTNVPMDVILLLDTSSSMRDRMAVVHDAANGFMKVLRPGDRGAVVAFAGNVRIVQDLTANPDAIESAINSTVANGSTALNNAVYIALKQFGRRAREKGEVRRQAIAVLSDGEDTSSLIAFDDVVALAREMGVNIYTIGLQADSQGREPSVTVPLSQSAYHLKTLARETGARAFFPATVHELKNVYGTISDELESQYSLAYVPTNPRSDGQFRRILVRVPTNPSYHPRTRTGYIADPVIAETGAHPGVLR